MKHEDIWITRKYVTKMQNAQSKGIEFDLPYISFKNMMKAKKCQLTGIKLTRSRNGAAKQTDITVDRIDNSKGYIKGNCMAVCDAANKFKSYVENPNNMISLEAATKIIKSMNSHNNP
jgi:hypothetical protein